MNETVLTKILMYHVFTLNVIISQISTINRFNITEKKRT